MLFCFFSEDGGLCPCVSRDVYSYKLTESPPSCRIALGTRDGSCRPQPLTPPQVEHPGQVTPHWRGFIKIAFS